MNLTMNIHVRGRTIWEIYDLAVIIFRRWWWQILLLALVPSLPIQLGMYHFVRSSPFLAELFAPSTFALYTFAIAPFLTMAVTPFLGEAMFSGDPSCRRALATAARSLLRLFVVNLLFRVPLALVWPLLPFLHSPFLSEVVLLERESFSRVSKRASALRKADSRRFAHAMLCLFIVVAGFVVVTLALSALIDLTTSSRLNFVEAADELQPHRRLLPWLTMPLLVTFIAVARFIHYLDVRSHTEGWEIEIELRRAAARIDPGAAG